MDRRVRVDGVLAARRELAAHLGGRTARAPDAAEGGCGVVGLACAEPVAGRHLLRALTQMRNRGNGKGGGIAAVGLAPERFGVDRAVLENDYLYAVAYLDPAARAEVERTRIEPIFDVDHVHRVDRLADPGAIAGLDVTPPEVVCYFVRPRAGAVAELAARAGLAGAPAGEVEDELVYQTTYALNRAFYADGVNRAFVLSHGKNLLVLKMVGYGDDVIRYYRLEDFTAHVWIGHHRYPTKGRVWHPGGAHPFIGLHEALVHNGDFANYAAVSAYLAERGLHPLYQTDTEVAALVFDLHHRLYGYPLEYVIESLAPTTERDFALLPAERRRVYAQIQRTHIHGSPDGPWFFIVAQSMPAGRSHGGAPAYRLVGITDTSMLRPQVFALQSGDAPIGLAASEKQAIDAVLSSLAGEDARFWSRADRYWSARGGSHTDGGAFVFTVDPTAPLAARLACTDKFGRLAGMGESPHGHEVPINGQAAPPNGHHVLTNGQHAPPNGHHAPPAAHEAALSGFGSPADDASAFGDAPPEGIFAAIAAQAAKGNAANVESGLASIEALAAQGGAARARAIEALTLLVDRVHVTGLSHRSRLLSRFDGSLTAVVDGIRANPCERFTWFGHGGVMPDNAGPDRTLVIDAGGYPQEGPDSLAMAVVAGWRAGWRRLLLTPTRGHRFIACGLGPATRGVRIDVYGAPGDYLASGIDGAEVHVHGDAQDQLGQIMKAGTLVVHGDVGQTFMYGAKGGEVYVRGSAAGRPLINAVGRPRVVINGTCLDYLAESFMAGDPLREGGFVVLNGVAFDDHGRIAELDTPYPGGNLFSLASGGAIYVRDPRGRVSPAQLNGGEFVPLAPEDWALIEPYLETNARHFGIPVARLLEVDGRAAPPERVYRKIRPRAHKALQAEEAWVMRKRS